MIPMSVLMIVCFLIMNGKGCNDLRTVLTGQKIKQNKNKKPQDLRDSVPLCSETVFLWQFFQLSVARVSFVTNRTYYLFSGTANHKSRPSVHSSHSGSLSSVSHHHNRTLSAVSRDQEHFARSLDFDGDSERGESSPTWPGMMGEFSGLPDELAEGVDQTSTWELSRDIVDSRTASPSRDSVISPSRDSPMKSPTLPLRSPSVTSRVASPSTRPSSAQSRREKEVASRGSSAASLNADEQWQEAVKAADSKEERKSSSFSRERIVMSRQSDHKFEENRVESDTRTSSAKSVSGGAETKATLGSEADLSQVSEAVVRSQSVAEGVYEDMLAEEETADREWPGVMEGAQDSEAGDVIDSDHNDSITRGTFTQDLAK